MDEKAKLNKKQITPSENYGSSTDLVRNDLENYYVGGVYVETIGGTKRFRLNRIYEDFEFPEKDGKRTLPGDQAVYNIYKREERETDPRPRFAGDEPLQTKTYFTRMELTASDSFFGELTSSFEEEGVYEDSYFEIGAPIEYVSNVDNKSLIQGDVDFVYNYGSETYEFLTNGRQEFKIPNLYEIPEKNLKNMNFDDLVAKENVIDYIITNADYYDTTAIQQEKEKLPFFNMVSFGNPIKTDEEELSESIINEGLSALFCDVLNLVQTGFLGAIAIGDILEEKEYTGTELVSSYKPDSNQTEFSETSSLFTEPLQKYDLSYFIEAIINLTTPSDEPGETEQIKSDIKQIRKVFGENELNATDILSDTDDELGNLELVEKLAAIEEDLQNIINKYSRNFEDVLAGKKPYCSDVLFYSIEKYEFGSSTPIQTFWIPSVFIYLGLDYIDSQVKYGKKYTYKVFAYKITLDTQLEYTYTIVGDEERIDDPPDDEPPTTISGGPDIENRVLPQPVFETVEELEGELGGSAISTGSAGLDEGGRT